MADHANRELLTPLDLLMPATYVQVFLTLETSEPTSAILPRLQSGLDAVAAKTPWISGRVLPTIPTPGQPPSLEIRWDAAHPTPQLVDKGVIQSSYTALSAQSMPPKSIPAHIWPLNPPAQDDTSGAPVFAASIFRFSDGTGLGLCVCIHHNTADATGITYLLSLWASATRELPLGPGFAGRRPRLARLTDALDPELNAALSLSVQDLWASHPELSKVAPTLPSEFEPCACELFRISTKKIDELKRRMQAGMGFNPTTTNLVTTLVWQAVTRARARRNPALLGQAMATRLVTAVNGRGRIGPGVSTPDAPYLGNAVLYALAELPVSQVVAGSGAPEENVVGISNAVFKSQSTDLINKRSIAELCSLVSRVDDYRGIFVGWDLFSSRDFTVTSWNGLELYELDFGEGLGKPQHVRPPYVEADGVGFILPRKRAVEGAVGAVEDDAVEVLVMLRKDDMACMMRDEEWAALQLGPQR